MEVEASATESEKNAAGHDGQRHTARGGTNVDGGTGGHDEVVVVVIIGFVKFSPPSPTI